MRKWALRLLLALAALSVATSARATPRRIAVLQPDGELIRALVLALSPWGVTPIRSEAPPPQGSAPEALRTASDVAHELLVEAVVWVSTSEQGALLWVFDAHTGEITTRLLTQKPPFDSATAAAVALSVKTVLRSSQIAPPEERLAVPPPPPPPPEPRVDPTLALQLGGGVQLVRPGRLALRGELAALVWIAAARRLGVGVYGATGPELRLEEPSFRGRYREDELGGTVRLRVLRTPRTSMTLALGGAAHFSTLRGTLLRDAWPRTVRRLNGSLDAEASASFEVVGGVYLGAALGGAYFPRYRRYLVEGTPIFSPWPVATSLKGILGVALF